MQRLLNQEPTPVSVDDHCELHAKLQGRTDGRKFPREFDVHVVEGGRDSHRKRSVDDVVRTDPLVRLVVTVENLDGTRGSRLDVHFQDVQGESEAKISGESLKSISLLFTRLKILKKLKGQINHLMVDHITFLNWLFWLHIHFAKQSRGELPGHRMIRTRVCPLWSEEICSECSAGCRRSSPCRRFETSCPRTWPWIRFHSYRWRCCRWCWPFPAGFPRSCRDLSNEGKNNIYF